MNRRGRATAFLLSLAVLLPACAGTEPWAGRETVEPQVAEEEPEEDAEILFPTHDSPGVGDAGISGRLVIQGRCLMLTSTAGGRGTTLPVWPASTSFDPEREAIVDEDGKIIVRVGEEMPGGSSGGVPSREHAERLAGEELPRECGGKKVTDNMIGIIGPWPEDPSVGKD